MVRTMELILGMRPLSQFDANATPMWRLFHAGADLKPYTATSESYATATLNTANSYGAARSAGWSFDREDLAPMGQLNEVLWHAVMGPATPYPADAGAAPDGE
nr:hypothetical protein [Candidatus Dormibacteraeota bacterium]